ncbi:protein ecdysoneless homolog [Battus philenor]|uniref:protein ecdysoneless homolog n=1 Tax=Battus philenor TaxID=42288 RepID=UPI0035CF6A37
MDTKNTKCEDTIQCFFFSFSLENINWNQLCETLNETITALSKGYIWHQDKLKIYQPINNNQNDIPPYLASTTTFGENIEDEWFIIYLIFKLTEIHNDLIVKIEDNDGDFLLIEAADFLPSWANPETTYNRVFIYDNHLHLIPPNIAELKTPMEINKALKLVKDYAEETKASAVIETSIRKRFNSYPNRIKELLHRTSITIPIDLAALLILEPTLISNVVNTYCHHDIIDAKICHNLKLENCVDVTIKFTKFQYAMLLHTKLINGIKQRKKCISTNSRTEIGYKLACGFKIIMSDANNNKSSVEFEKYLNHLTQNGYFKNNIVGSQNYNELLDKAKKYFLDTECSTKSCVNEKISHLMSSKEYIDIKQSLIQKPQDYLGDEDSDNWLNIDSETLDNMLKKSHGKQVESEDLIGPSVVTSGLSNFLSQKSDFEGVEETRTTPIEYDNKIKFDSSEFFESIEKMLNIVTLSISDEESSESGDNEIEDFLVTEKQLEQELKAKICSEQNTNSSDDAVILSNFIKSIKEEGLSGPSSTLLRSIGIDKTEFLDSDDDTD